MHTAHPRTEIHKTRGRHSVRHFHDRVMDRLPGVPGADFAEVDAGDLEHLLADLADDDLPEAHEHAAAEPEPEVHETAVTRTVVRRASTRDHDADYGHDDYDDRRGGDIPDIWMQKGGKAPLLTPAQELVLAKRVERGDQSAREELLNANVRLVASVARRYLGRGLTLDDLMQEGFIGLLRAIDKYNYRKGFRFSTYATHWIRQAVSRALANQGRSIRLPAHVVDTLSRITRLREELFHKLGRIPTRIELADAAGLTEKKLVQLLKSAAQPVSLEAPVGPEGEARLGDFIQADEETTPAERTFKYLVRDELEHALNTLNPREKEVIALRYGLDDEEPHTLEETGRRLHITRERARQIEAKAMEKLRKPHVTQRLHETLT